MPEHLWSLDLQIRTIQFEYRKLTYNLDMPYSSDTYIRLSQNSPRKTNPEYSLLFSDFYRYYDMKLTSFGNDMDFMLLFQLPVFI